MKDQNGIYYLPDPADLKTRVYVRAAPGAATGAAPGAATGDASGNPGGGKIEPEFRLWRADRPEVWERHGWIGLAAITAAAEAYKAWRVQMARSCPAGAPAGGLAGGPAGPMPGGSINPNLAQADPLRLYDLEVARALLKFES